MINSNNSIYVGRPGLPQKIEAPLGDAVKSEKNPGQIKGNDEFDKLNISENLDVKKEDYRILLEQSQTSVSLSQNTIKNIDEVQKSILDYKNTDEKELKKEDFLNNIEKNISEVQKIVSDGNTNQIKAVSDVIDVLSQVKEKIPFSGTEEEKGFLEKTYNDVSGSKEEINKNIKSVLNSVQSAKEENGGVIKDKQAAADVMDGIRFVMKGNPEHVKDIQKKAISGDTILALLKAV